MSREMTLEWLVLLVLASVVVVVGAISCRPQVEERSLSRIKEAGELVVGVDPSYPPFAAVDEKGRIVGYDIDLAEDIARRLGVAARFVSVDIGSIHDGLLAKKFDVIISSLPPFPEFTKKISYSRPYFNAGQVLVVRQTTNDVHTLDDLVGRSVGVEGASAADIEVRKLAGSSLNLTVHPYVSPDLALAALKVGEVDAAVVDAVTALEFIRRDKSVQIVGEPLTVEPYVVAARKADVSLLKEIDRALVELEDDGTGEKLRQRWLGANGG